MFSQSCSSVFAAKCPSSKMAYLFWNMRWVIFIFYLQLGEERRATHTLTHLRIHAPLFIP